MVNFLFIVFGDINRNPVIKSHNAFFGASVDYYGGFYHGFKIADSAVVAAFGAFCFFIFKVFGKIAERSCGFYVIKNLRAKNELSIFKLLFHFFDIVGGKFVVHIISAFRFDNAIISPNNMVFQE